MILTLCPLLSFSQKIKLTSSHITFPGLVGLTTHFIDKDLAKEHNLASWAGSIDAGMGFRFNNHYEFGLGFKSIYNGDHSVFDLFAPNISGYAYNIEVGYGHTLNEHWDMSLMLGYENIYNLKRRVDCYSCSDLNTINAESFYLRPIIRLNIVSEIDDLDLLESTGIYIDYKLVLNERLLGNDFSIGIS